MCWARPSAWSIRQAASRLKYQYLFAGMEYESATSLYHTYARYYSPGLQRFLSEDPLQFGGGDVSLFAYARNDPVNHSDPLGLYLSAPGMIPPGTSITSPIDTGIGAYLAGCGKTYLMKSLS